MSRFLPTLLILFTCFALKAQERAAPKHIVIDEHLVVKDSTGKVLAYSYWHPLLLTGNYSIQSNYTVNDTTHRLHYLTLKQKEQFAAMRLQNTPQPRIDSTVAPAPVAAPEAFQLGIPPRQSAAFPLGHQLDMQTIWDMDGKRIDNKLLAGKIVVLNFWFIGCPPCKAEIPELNKLVAENSPDPNITFIAIALDKRWDINSFRKQIPFNYRQVADARWFCDSYSVTQYPTNVIIDKNGIIRYSSVGYGQNYIAWMKKTIEDIKSGN